jgi:hypothetical protein
MDLHRYEWFWDGDGQPFYFRITRLSEWNQEAPKAGEAPPGSIRNVTIHNVIAHSQGGSLIAGHPESWLEGVSLENVKLFLSADPTAPYELTTQALDFRWARNLKVKNFEINWEKTVADKWGSALSFEEVNRLTVDGFSGRPAWPERDAPAVRFNNVADAIIRNSQAVDGTKTFLKVAGKECRAIYLLGNDLRNARVGYTLSKEVAPNAVGTLGNVPTE